MLIINALAKSRGNKSLAHRCSDITQEPCTRSEDYAIPETRMKKWEGS